MVSESTEHSLSQRTWEEIDAWTQSGNDTVILPVGATEQHGPHLGVGMDTNLAEHLSQAVSKETKVPVLPVVPYGCSLGHSQRWPGTIALQPQTLIDMITEIGDWVYASGFRRIYILNTHVTNFAPLRCALEVLRARYDDLMIALLNSGQVSERVHEVFGSDAEDWHANKAETALMQYLSPGLVREERIATADDTDRTTDLVFAHPVNRTSKNGVTGRPSEATAELGKQLFAWMVEDIAHIVEQGKQEAPPLSISYFNTKSKKKEGIDG